MLYKNYFESIECYFDFLIALSVWLLGDTLYMHYILFLSIILPTNKNYCVFFQPGENVSYNYNIYNWLLLLIENSLYYNFLTYYNRFALAIHLDYKEILWN